MAQYTVILVFIPVSLYVMKLVGHVYIHTFIYSYIYIAIHAYFHSYIHVYKPEFNNKKKIYKKIHLLDYIILHNRDQLYLHRTIPCNLQVFSTWTI